MHVLPRFLTLIWKNPIIKQVTREQTETEVYEEEYEKAENWRWGSMEV